MKINPLEWKALKNEKAHKLVGIVRVRSSAPFLVRFKADGREVSLGFEAYGEVALSEPSEVTFSGTAEVYLKVRPSRVVRMTGEKFTNLDKRPVLGEHYEAITRASRMFQLEQRATMRALRQERADIEAAVRRSRKPVREPVVETAGEVAVAEQDGQVVE